MIYLIKTFGPGRNKTALKVGYSGDPVKRFESYRIQNPFFEIVSSREGDQLMETRMHLFLTAVGLKESFLSEWFKDLPQTRELFHAKVSKMNDYIWRFRDSLIKESDIKGRGSQNRLKIYETLRLERPILKARSIDLAWKRESNVKLLKSLKDDEPRTIYRLPNEK